MSNPSSAKTQRDVRRALVCAGLLVALQVAAKSARDALFCAAFSPAELPRVMTAGAALSVGFALGASRLFRAFGPGRVVPALLVASAIGFGIEYLLLPVSPRPVSLVLYLHVAAVGAVVVSGFWSVVSEHFDPHALRTSMSRIGIGATAGGLSGGLFAERISSFGGARSTLLGLLALSVLGTFLMGSLGRPIDRGTPARAPGAPRGVLDSSYIHWLSAFVALTALSSSVIDFAFKARAMERYQSAEDLVQFFGFFYTATSLGALLVQALVTPRLLEREGLEVALAALPAALVASGLGALILPGILTQSLLKGVDGALGNSLHRSAYEPLYTPLPPDRKRGSKAVIDVVIDKAGDGLGSLIAWALVVAFPAAATLGATGVAIVVALFCLLLTVRLQRGYVAQLAASLRNGSVRLEDFEVRDRTTRLTLSRTQLEIDRERLLAEIQGLRERGQLNAGAASDVPRSSPSASRLGADAEDIQRKIQDLVSNDAQRVQNVLAEPATDVRVVPFVVPLLARDDLAQDAMNFLAAFGERAVGQLADALLDTQHGPVKLRRRVARVLASIGGIRAAQSLALALSDPDFGVRRQVARGLAELARADVRPPLERSRILALVARDLREERHVRPEQRIEYAFTLLGLVLDPEALALAHRALTGPDQKLRGTALEYLENVLPADVRGELQDLIRAGPLPAARREEGELLAELKRTLG